jgi:membrane protein DedA with SNARE-associated domain
VLAVSINIIETLSSFVIAIIEHLGYAGVFVGMTLESTGLPLPSEIIMGFAGYVVWEGKLTLLGITLAGTLGCLAGSLIAYGIGAYGGRPLLERYGKYVLIRKSELDRGEEWFAKHGESAVFISRLLPVVRSVISYPAGIVRMDIKRFSLFCLRVRGRRARAALGGYQGTTEVLQYRGHRGASGACRVPHLPQSVGHGTAGRTRQAISDSRKGHTSESPWMDDGKTPFCSRR